MDSKQEILCSSRAIHAEVREHFGFFVVVGTVSKRRVVMWCGEREREKEGKRDGCGI
jgi:hypothetical protein